VVKGLARLHGGRLELSSKLGEGTTTTISLPLDYTNAELVDGLGQAKAVTAA
jgi:signal transduction histidine kinase